MLFGSEQKVLKKVQEIYRIREQDALARKLALERIAPERALAKEQKEKVAKIAKTLQEKGISLEELEKMIEKIQKRSLSSVSHFKKPKLL